MWIESYSLPWNFETTSSNGAKSLHAQSLPTEANCIRAVTQKIPTNGLFWKAVISLDEDSGLRSVDYGSTS